MFLNLVLCIDVFFYYSPHPKIAFVLILNESCARIHQYIIETMLARQRSSYTESGSTRKRTPMNWFSVLILNRFHFMGIKCNRAARIISIWFHTKETLRLNTSALNGEETKSNTQITTKKEAIKQTIPVSLSDCSSLLICQLFVKNQINDLITHYSMILL